MQKIGVNVADRKLGSVGADNVVKPVTDPDLGAGAVQIMHVHQTDVDLAQEGLPDPGRILFGYSLQLFRRVRILESNALDDPSDHRHLFRRKQIDRLRIQQEPVGADRPKYGVNAICVQRVGKLHHVHADLDRLRIQPIVLFNPVDVLPAISVAPGPKVSAVYIPQVLINRAAGIRIRGHLVFPALVLLVNRNLSDGKLPPGIAHRGVMLLDAPAEEGFRRHGALPLLPFGIPGFRRNFTVSQEAQRTLADIGNLPGKSRIAFRQDPAVKQLLIVVHDPQVGFQRGQRVIQRMSVCQGELDASAFADLKASGRVHHREVVLGVRMEQVFFRADQLPVFVRPENGCNTVHGSPPYASVIQVSSILPF